MRTKDHDKIIIYIRNLKILENEPMKLNCIVLLFCYSVSLKVAFNWTFNNHFEVKSLIGILQPLKWDEFPLQVIFGNFRSRWLRKLHGTTTRMYFVYIPGNGIMKWYHAWIGTTHGMNDIHAHLRAVKD